MHGRSGVTIGPLPPLDSEKFKEEIVPVPLAKKKGDIPTFEADETPRRETTLEKLAKLSPVYKDGVCTAGNSSSENDGAAAIVLMSEPRPGNWG